MNSRSCDAHLAATCGQTPPPDQMCIRDSLGVENKDLIEILQEEGIEVTSHASTISQEEAAMVEQLLTGGEGTLEAMEDGALDLDLDLELDLDELDGLELE